MHYYYLDGLEKKGPYTVEELKVRNLKPETLVFSEEMENWKPIKEIESLNLALFEDKIFKNESQVEESFETAISPLEVGSSEEGITLEMEGERGKIKVPSILILLILYGIAIGIAYFIATTESKKDLANIYMRIDKVLKGKSAVTDYVFDGSDGQLYDVYLASLFEGFKNDKSVARTAKVTLALKPTPNSSDISNPSTYYKSQLKRWNLFKGLVQYYECSQFTGFEVLRLEKNFAIYSITESWSGDMGYKVPESRYYPGYNDGYFSSPGYSVPTYRPSVHKCYEESAKYLTSDREDKSYDAGVFSEISSFPAIETKFYEISQRFPKYKRLLNKIQVDMGNGRRGDITDNARITGTTSATDAYVYTDQWVVWYKSITNTYSVEDKYGVFNRYWLIYSLIGLAAVSITYFLIKYRKRIALD